MDKNRTFLDYVGQVFVIFGGTIGVMNLFCLVFGEGARGYSSMFSLGGEGLSIATTGQFFLISVITVALRYLFFSDKIFKKLSLAVRSVFDFLSVFAVTVAFVIVFRWLPIDQWEPWLGFLLCFGGGVAVSTVVAIRREKAENAKMDRALERYKKEN